MKLHRLTFAALATLGLAGCCCHHSARQSYYVRPAVVAASPVCPTPCPTACPTPCPNPGVVPPAGLIK